MMLEAAVAIFGVLSNGGSYWIYCVYCGCMVSLVMFEN